MHHATLNLGQRPRCPTPPHAPGEPPHTPGFGTLPRASVYVSVAETASLRRLFLVACGRLPCPR
eukprot:scaffold65215_cov33-Phaeocystis_antarctica.AAC.1